MIDDVKILIRGEDTGKRRKIRGDFRRTRKDNDKKRKINSSSEERNR